MSTDSRISRGNISKIKNSTLFPVSWSNDATSDAVKRVANTNPKAIRSSDGAALYLSKVNGVDSEVIVVNEKITAGYPAGAQGLPSTKYFLTGKH